MNAVENFLIEYYQSVILAFPFFIGFVVWRHRKNWVMMRSALIVSIIAATFGPAVWIAIGLDIMMEYRFKRSVPKKYPYSYLLED